MNKKQKIALVVLLFAGIGGVYAYTRKKNTTQTPQKPLYQPDTEISKRVDEAIKNGETEVEFSLSEITEQIHLELSSANSSGRVILALLENINEEQFGEIIKLFDKRAYSTLTKQNLGEGLADHALPFWLKHDLPPKYYEQLKQKYPKHL